MKNLTVKLAGKRLLSPLPGKIVPKLLLGHLVKKVAAKASCSKFLAVPFSVLKFEFGNNFLNVFLFQEQNGTFQKIGSGERGFATLFIWLRGSRLHEIH